MFNFRLVFIERWLYDFWKLLMFKYYCFLYISDNFKFENWYYNKLLL